MLKTGECFRHSLLENCKRTIEQQLPVVSISVPLKKKKRSATVLVLGSLKRKYLLGSYIMAFVNVKIGVILGGGTQKP